VRKPKLSASVKRGKEVFEKAGCASCHSGQYHTDLDKHDVGTGEVRDEGKKFDTPALVELWRTAPYLYDGRAATVQEVLTKFNPDDNHGETSDLTKKEIRDLAQFLLSL
jgi:cytochrome c peroxidase